MPAAVLLGRCVDPSSGLTPFAPGCEGVPAAGTVYINAEVEPSIAVNPANPNHFIGAWQQDRWSGGGSRGLVTAFTLDGGGTWTRGGADVPLQRRHAGQRRQFRARLRSLGDHRAGRHRVSGCIGIQQPGQWPERDPGQPPTDGGRTWGNAVSVRSDGAQDLNDKESITADPTDARYVYVVWDRLTGNHGPTWFARTSDGGATWEPARAIYDPAPTARRSTTRSSSCPTAR